MAKLGRLKQDLRAENEGVWVHYADGFHCRLARQGNDDFQRARRRLQANQEQIAAAAGGDTSEQEARDILAPYIAEFVVRDWKGLENDDGTPIPYSVEKATELLRTPELKDWYNWVLQRSSSAVLFRQRDEVEQGNSSSTSDG